MKLSEAIKILDDTIPPPDNKMYDSAHIDIGIAWRVIKTCLCEHATKLCIFCKFDDECRLKYGDSEQCKELIKGEKPKP